MSEEEQKQITLPPLIIPNSMASTDYIVNTFNVTEEIKGKDLLNTDILVLAFRIVHGKWLDICKTNEDKYGTEYREWLMSNDNKIRYKSFGFNDILNQVMEYILVYADIKVETEEINVEESAIPEVMEVMDKKNDKLQVIEEEFDIESLPVLTRNIVDVIKHHIESNTYGKANELLATAYKMKELDKFMPALKHLYNIQMEIYNHKIQSMPHNEKFSVIYISGMSPKYKELIKDRTILEHWYKFYEELHNTEEGKLPFFNFHYEYIETFAYDFLNPAFACMYVGFVKAQFLRTVGGFDTESQIKMTTTAYDNILSQLDKLIISLTEEKLLWEQKNAMETQMSYPMEKDHQTFQKAGFRPVEMPEIPPMIE